MHGDKTQGQRERALARFEAGKVDTLVATDVAARGIDVDGISHVINFDPPEDREGYVHRTGRTGRAGRTGSAVTFVGGDQARDVGRIAHELRLHAEFERAGLVHAGRSHGRDDGSSGPRGGYGGGRNKRRPRSSTGTGSTTGSRRKVASARPGRRSGRR
jgi:superfamily II DNA/RNA helicase